MTTASKPALTDKQFYAANAAVSLVAVVFLFWLIYFHEGTGDRARADSILPALIASFNGICAILLAAGLWAIKRGKPALHQGLMIAAFAASAAFLVTYVIYHSLHGDTKFTGEGWIRPLYFFILITHIVLSIVNLPLILTTFYLSLTKRFAQHKRLARIVWPSWMYVSITGVVIFLFLRAYS